MGFFSRLISPETNRLTLERDWFRAQFEETYDELSDAKRELKAEINRNRRREDAFLNIIVQAGTDRNVPKRQPDEEPKDTPPTEPTLSQAQEILLRDRAEQYVRQKFDVYSPDEVERIFQIMKADPEEWLKDS
jgi:hypothetical protein